jgi:hypothetical protein
MFNGYFYFTRTIRPLSGDVNFYCIQLYATVKGTRKGLIKQTLRRRLMKVTVKLCKSVIGVDFTQGLNTSKYKFSCCEKSDFDLRFDFFRYLF